MSRRQDYIIYVPGLGDAWDPGRRFLLSFWRIWHVEAVLLPMAWRGPESLDAKLRRIHQVIEQALASGHRVSLIGESAGGSIVLNVFADRPADIYRVITVCGLNNPNVTLNSRLSARNKSLQASLDKLAQSLKKLQGPDRKRITNFHPIVDPVVSIKDTIVPGSHEQKLASAGHMRTIVACLTVYSRRIVRSIES